MCARKCCSRRSVPVEATMRHRRASAFCVVLFITSTTTFGSSTPSLHGVHPLDRRYFNSKIIKCKDGTASFTRDRLNDNFCDCIDGTDEPGTSACSRGRFYCKNMGSTPQFLFSSRVNDNICDCCDGSDEYDSRISCPNTCIMGGNLVFQAEKHHSTVDYLNVDDEKESRGDSKLDDLILSLKGLKALAILQLALVCFLLTFWFFCRRAKSRRRRHR